MFHTLRFQNLFVPEFYAEKFIPWREKEMAAKAKRTEETLYRVEKSLVSTGWLKSLTVL